jgi:vanillate O-demethylase ferredoxin subunit
MAAPNIIEVLVKSVSYKADGIHAWELRAVDGSPLPPFTAGAHIDLHLANGMVRSYSLCNSQEERHRYVVAINRDAASRGGSAFIHDTLKAGDRVKISPPANNFELVETAPHVVFIAGGIGITPIFSMVLRLEALSRSWELHFSTRLKSMCAFKEELEAIEAKKPSRVFFNYDHEPGGKMTDLVAVIGGIRKDAHLYCCGPNPMLQAFEEAAKQAQFGPGQIHLEYFSAKEAPALEGGFTVELARTGKTLQVPPGKSILKTLLDNGVEVPFSCTQGVCGSCETAVLSGEPDHRDLILTEAERAANQTMMICCSGSKSARLVLDI